MWGGGLIVDAGHSRGPVAECEGRLRVMFAPSGTRRI
jgi:hypothetical protein